MGVNENYKLIKGSGVNHKDFLYSIQLKNKR